MNVRTDSLNLNGLVEEEDDDDDDEKIGKI